MRAFNRPELVQAFRRLLLPDEMASFTPDVLEQLQLVLDAGYLDDTPYLRLGLPGLRAASVAAVAAKNGYLFVVAGEPSLLQVRRITVINTDVATHRFQLQVLTAANVATLGAPAGTVPLIDVSSPVPGTPLGSRMSGVTNAAVLGTNIDTIQVPATDTRVIELRDASPSLDGAAGGAIAIVCVDQNMAFGAAFHAREYPKP